MLVGDLFIPADEKVVLDLHNMQVDEARFYLERAIDTSEHRIREIVVIHGYRQGQGILNMVRNEFKHKRIEKKVVPFNNGMTYIQLKKG